MKNHLPKPFVCLTILFVLASLNFTYAKSSVLQRKSNAYKATKTDTKFNPKNKINDIESNTRILNFPIAFEQNKGQINENVRFLTRGNGYNLSLESNKAVFQYQDLDCLLRNRTNKVDSTKNKTRFFKPCESYRLGMKMLNANSNALIQGIDELPAKSNYITGNDSTKWLSGISNYQSVRYSNIYAGIDVVFRGSEQNLEYDFHISPKADPNLIQLEFEEIKRVKISANGDLVFKFKGLEIRHHKPIAYQIIDGQRQEVTAKFVSLGKNKIGFTVGKYDEAKELIIDPVITEESVNDSIIYATYLGGSRQDTTQDIAIDSAGYIYLASDATSEDFLNHGGLVNNRIAHSSDIFVTKLNPEGTQIIYNTVIGGAYQDIPWAIDVDDSGNVYVGGQTSSPNFPMVNARQTSNSLLDQYDVEGFVFKLNSSGSSLSYSTYHGATSNRNGYDTDWVESIDVDSNGNLYAVGETGGADFPVKNGFQMSRNPNDFDAYLSKFSPSGELLYSTLFGSARPSTWTIGFDVAADNNGFAYLSGEVSYNTQLPVTANAYQTGGSNGYVAKFNTNKSGSSSLVYATYTESNGEAIEIDSEGNAVTIGSTNPRHYTGYAVKLNSSGTNAIFKFATEGGVSDIAINSKGNIYFAQNMNVIENYRNSYDVKVTGYSPTGRLLGKTTIQGESFDRTTGIALDSGDNIYVVGYTGSRNFPTTTGALQPGSRYAGTYYGSSQQGFLAKVKLDSPERREPLIFIPGVSGSWLDAIESDGSKTNLWLGLLRNHDRLTLDPNQTQANIIASDVIREIVLPIVISDPPHPTIIKTYSYKVYKQMLDKLIDGEGYKEYRVNGQPERRTIQGCDVSGQLANKPDLFVFAYDWRKSNIENAEALKDYVGCVRQFYPDSKVNILAHSMGGLLARRYIISNPNDHYVDKMVTIASPWLGAPKAIEVLKTGNFDLSPIVWNSTIRRLGEFFTGMHELLPSQTYFDAATRSDFHLTNYGKPFKEEGWDVNGNGTDFENYDYDQMASLLNQQHHRSNPGSANQLLHDTAGQDNWLGDTSGVKYFHIYGQQSYLNTPVQVIAKYRVQCYPSENSENACDRENFYDVIRGRGDKTVPTISAERSFGPYYNLLPRNDKPFFSPNRSQDESVEHVKLTQNPAVQQEVINFLKSDTQQSVALNSENSLTNEVISTRKSLFNKISFKKKPSISTASFQESGAETVEMPLREGYYVSVSGTDYVEIKDDLGNINSLLDGGYMLPIPSISYDLTSERSASISTPTEGSYTLTFRTGSEPIFLETIKGLGNLNPTEAARYVDLNLPANSNVQLHLSSSGIGDLRYDSDEDGNFETILPPTSHTIGDAAKDITPPTVQISEITQPSRQLIINSSDVESGVKRIYYSFDGTNFQEYVSSIALSRSRSGTIYTFADDNSANRSLITTFTFVAIPDPVVNITSPLSGSVFPIGTSVNFTGSFSGDNCNSHTASWTFDNISQTGTVNESNGTVTTNYTFTSAGVYLASLTVNNGCGGTGTATTVDDLTAMVVIYDPDGGFVTGGGWIDSSVGAYPTNPNLTGKANFSINSKYKKGDNVPTGNTEFKFGAANNNFKSTSYDWLVITGAKAQYKGSGSINGSGDYGFMLTSIDGKTNDGGGMDKFRIKIWDKNSGVIIYDNQLGTPDDTDPATVIGSGSIIIHRQ